MADEVLPISALSFDPANPRLRTERSAHVIRSSLQRYGPLRSLVGQKLPDGRIVIRAGNGTLEEAGQIGIEKVRLIQRRADELVVVVADDLDDEKWIQYSVDDNRASDLSTWDPAILEQISQDIDLSNSFLEGELDELIESLAGLTERLGEDELFEGETDPDDVPDFDEVETRVKKGDIWRLGRHRVMCGDSTVITDVERLMDGSRIECCISDPPYGIGFCHGGRDTSGIGKGKYKTKFAGVPVAGDDHSFDPSPFLSFPLLLLWGANHFASKLPDQSSWLVWDKRAASQHSNDFADCEIAWCNTGKVARVFRHQWDGMIKASERGQPRVHPTQKPVELMIWCIEQMGSPDKIYDPFLGSGTTLIAAEKTGRTCYGMELSEKYCDVILKRWEDFTGQTAERI